LPFETLQFDPALAGRPEEIAGLADVGPFGPWIRDLGIALCFGRKGDVRVVEVESER
jgi:hypothetical protein